MPSGGDFHPVSDGREVLIQGEFTIRRGKHNATADISLCREKITYQCKNATKSNESLSNSIALSDVIGCRTLVVDDQQNSAVPKLLTGNAACLQVFAYIYNKAPANGGVRRRLQLDLYCDQHDAKEENKALVERWKLIIQSLLKGVEFSSVDDLTEALLPLPPHYLVCINPSSGKGKAGQLFKQHVQPVFEEAGLSYKVITTERQGHGVEIGRNLDLKQYSGIIIVSGDGLIYEFIQGFKERDDKEEAFKVPFGIIPGGSGNAMCAAILSQNGEQVLKSEALHAAFTIVKGKAHPKDIVQIENGQGTFFSFLAVAWGLIADIDIESERFRFMGEVRFTIGAVTRIVFLRKVPGRLSFLPVEDPSKYAHLLQKQNGKKSSQHGNHSNSGMENKRESQMDQGSERTEEHADQTPEKRNDMAMGQNVSGKDGDHVSVELPPLNEPVPSNWTVIEGDFVTVVVSFMSHLSRDFLTHPGQALDEGVITLHYMTGSATRGQLSKLFDEVKTGEYIGGDYSECRFVKAFRLEPLNEDGILTLDGERVRYGPIQGAMMPLKCQCIA